MKLRSGHNTSILGDCPHLQGLCDHSNDDKIIDNGDSSKGIASVLTLQLPNFTKSLTYDFTKTESHIFEAFKKGLVFSFNFADIQNLDSATDISFFYNAQLYLSYKFKQEYKIWVGDVSYNFAIEIKKGILTIETNYPDPFLIIQLTVRN